MTVHAIDRQIGLFAYATKEEGIGGRIRVHPDDFRVEEVVDPGFIEQLSSSLTQTHGYPVYLLEKHGMDTMHACNKFGGILHSRIHYLGLKDSRAVSLQYVSTSKKMSDAPLEVVFNHNRAKLIGYAEHPLTRRSLRGNRFSITLRGVDWSQDVQGVLEDVAGKVYEMKVPNFYGYQRFGSSRAVTHLVGRALVKGQHKEAVAILLNHSCSDDSGLTEISKDTSTQGDTERLLARSLASNPGEYLLALRRLPVSLRRLFISAYRSYVFNLTLSSIMERGSTLCKLAEGDFYCTYFEGELSKEIRRFRGSVEGEEIVVPLVPLVGYGFKERSDQFSPLIQDVLDNEGVDAGNFYLCDMPEISAEVGFRPAPLLARDLKWSCQEDADILRLEFTLYTGCYATILLREIMKPLNPKESGF